MKDLKAHKESTAETSLVDQVMNSKPEFASKEEAIAAYTKRLNDLAQKNGCSVSEMLNKAEHSPEFNETCEEAMDLWSTLSFLKRK